MLVRRGSVLLLLVALAGCSGGTHRQAHSSGPPLVIPQPSHSPTGRPRPARPGTVCGRINTVTGAQARVIVVRGRTTCAEALRIFRKYNDPATPAEGTAGLVVIDHWTCETQRGVSRCTSRATVIEERV